MKPAPRQPYRVARRGRSNAARTVEFTFDGTSYTGVEGDTVASALLANGVHLMGRSFKYHRPRGPIAAGPEEPNALVSVRRAGANAAATHVPNVRATCQEIFDGLEVTSQNRWPSLSFDVGAVNNALSPFFPAGFYYKTFIGPTRKAWDKVYEPFIRRAAGLGEAPTEPDPDHYANRFAHVDVLVVGGGAAGLAAARAAAERGDEVMLVDENPQLGGWLLSDADAMIDGVSAPEWAAREARAIADLPNVRVLTRTTAFGYFQQNMVALSQRVTDHLSRPDPDLPRERMWQVRAGRVVLAQGAIERHVVFPGNDRPGIVLAGAAQTWLNRHGVIVGTDAALVTANDSAYAAIFDLAEEGVEVPVIVEHRAHVSDEIAKQAAEFGIRIVTGATVTGTGGRQRVDSLTYRDASGTEETVEVDAVLMSAGWTPSLHLYSQSRGKPRWDEGTQRFLPARSPQDCITVGGCNGTDTLADAIAEGMLAGGSGAEPPKVEDDVTTAGGMIGATGEAASKGMAFVDYQNDVKAKDVALAVQEGMHSIEHVKRYTTTGMATDQGKLSNMHALAIAAGKLSRPIPKVGLTTFRTPYTPVTFGTFVGHASGPLFDPERRTPIDAWSEAQGAVFEPVALWRRAWYYPRAGEDMHDAVARECRTVRQTAGVFDASTLGKIEVTGPDAAAFMDRIYTNGWQKLKAGRCKYGIMLREDGFIYDDGVVGKLSDTRFHVTTTTGGAPRVLAHMEDYLQTEFPQMDVHLTSTTEQWAVIAVQGPKAREIVAPLVAGLDIGADAFPHMSVAECTVAGAPARLFRMSFTGEVGFEINVPAGHGRAVWDAVWERAEAMGACAYGTETMHVLRAEKGYIIVGQDTDGTVTPHDAGLSWAIAKSKPDYVGKRGLERADLVAEGRRQLVGLETADPATVLEEGAQIVEDPEQETPVKMIGWVTSSYFSPNVPAPDGSEGRSIAMALIENGRARMGETLHVPMPDGTAIAVTVRDTAFVDPKGERLHG